MGLDLLLRIPDWIEQTLIDGAFSTAAAKHPPRFADVSVRTLSEGRVVQTLHVGSFDDEGPLLARMHDEWMPRHGLRPTGTHHEIYLSDTRRTPPQRRRTILRQPVVDA